MTRTISSSATITLILLREPATGDDHSPNATGASRAAGGQCGSSVMFFRRTMTECGWTSPMSRDRWMSSSERSGRDSSGRRIRLSTRGVVGMPRLGSPRSWELWRQSPLSSSWSEGVPADRQVLRIPRRTRDAGRHRATLITAERAVRGQESWDGQSSILPGGSAILRSYPLGSSITYCRASHARSEISSTIFTPRSLCSSRTRSMSRTHTKTSGWRSELLSTDVSFASGAM